MKIHSLIYIILCLNSTQIFAQKTFSIDTKNSIVNWIGYAEMGNYAPAGDIKFKQGQVIFKAGKISMAILILDMKTMQQSNADLLGHLKSADFFHIEKYPTSIVKISKVTQGKAYGQLTIKNKTRPLICPINDKTADGITTISGRITLDRVEYGIVYNSNSFFANLGDHAIRNTFDVTFKVVIK